VKYRNQVEFLSKNKKTIMKGTIKTLTDRGFGFIAQEGVAKDLFFHSKDLNGVMFDSLKVGDVVTFEVVEGPKGPAASNVQKA
jgi:CspA family cold shock protein